MKAQDVHDAEQAVLGSVLLSPNCLDSVRAVIGDEGRVFVSEPHQLLYRAMLHLQVGGLPIDPLTLKQRLAEDRELDAVGRITYIGEGLSNGQGASK